MAVRVLMLGWEYPPRISGGLGVACEGLGRALAKVADVRLVLPAEVAEGVGGGGIEVVGAYGVGRGLYGEGMWEKVEGFAADVVGRVGGGDFDVIHAHDWMTLVAGMALKERTGKPLVAHVHSLEFDRSGRGVRGWVYDAEKQGMEQADVVVAVSGYTAGVCGREYGIGRGKIAVVHNGVEAGVVVRQPREELVVFVGRLAWQKGGEMFVRVAERVRERFPEVRFVMAGDGELRDQLVGRGVEVLGFLERDEVFALLARAKVFCMPSVSEPFGIAALEAAVAGVPVVLSRQSGVREVLGAARLVDGWDETGWVGEVCRLLENESERREVGTAVRHEAQRCSWDGAAARVLGVYREWLGVG